MNKIFLKIGFNTLIQLSGKAISVVLSLATVSLITRYLGSSGYGDFALAFTYVSFFSVFADFGLQVAMVRELAENEYGKHIYGNFFSLKLLLILFSTLLAFIILLFFPYMSSVKIGICIAIIAVAISGITNYGTSVFQSRIRLDLVTLIDVITKIVTVGFITIFVYYSYNFYYIIFSVLLGNIVGLVVTFFLLKETFYFTFNKPLIKKYLLMSFPLGMMSLAGIIYFKIDMLMLSVMKNTTEVGYYSLSYKVLENFVIVWGFYMASAFPLFAKYNGKKDVKNMKDLLRNSFFIAFAISLPIILVVYIYASFIITIIAGESFQESIDSLRILIFSLPFLFMNNLFSDFLIVLKANKIIFTGILLSLVVNIILNLLFIPLYGFIGASYVTVMSALFLTIYSFIVVYFKLHPAKKKYKENMNH